MPCFCKSVIILTMPKKSKATKTTIADSDAQDDSKKINYEELVAQDPQFYRGTNKFAFPNGDEYDGHFYAHASGLVWRQGRGSYKTNDGQIYTGEWDGDKLDETKEIQITYPDGTKFSGNLLKNKYTGPGIYQLEEKVSLMCDFSENKPLGEISLIDPNEKAWHGFAEKDECLLIPEHAFYRCLNKDLGKGRHRKDPERAESTSGSKGSRKSSLSSAGKGPKYSDIRDVEKRVFAKSKKTSSDLQIEQSEWYQEYEQFKNAYGEIVCKAMREGDNALLPDEYAWYVQYKEFEKRYKQLLNDFKNKTKGGKAQDVNRLFEIIHSEEYRVKNRPIPVFFAREEAGEGCDSTCEC